MVVVALWSVKGVTGTLGDLGKIWSNVVAGGGGSDGFFSFSSREIKSFP